MRRDSIAFFTSKISFYLKTLPNVSVLMEYGLNQYKTPYFQKTKTKAMFVDIALLDAKSGNTQLVNQEMPVCAFIEIKFLPKIHFYRNAEEIPRRITGIEDDLKKLSFLLDKKLCQVAYMLIINDLINPADPFLKSFPRVKVWWNKTQYDKWNNEIDTVLRKYNKVDILYFKPP